MSFSMVTIPTFYIPPISYATAGTTAKAVTAEATAKAVTAATSITQNAAGITASSAAFAAVALPIAITVLAGLAAGVTYELVKQEKTIRNQHVVQMETFFTSKENLINALVQYDKNHECEIFVNEQEDTIIARYKFEDYIFQHDEQSGFYKLIIKNAGICEKVLKQVNDIQNEYCKAVKTSIVNRLYEKSSQNGWIIENDYEDEEETRTIMIRTE